MPAPRPARMAGYLDIGLAGCLGVCVPVRVVQSMRGPVSALAPASLSLSVCRRHAVATHLVQLPLPSSLRRSPSACLGRHSQSGVGARRCGSLGTDGEAERGTEWTHPEARASVHDTSEAVLTVASIDPLCVRPSQ